MWHKVIPVPRYRVKLGGAPGARVSATPVSVKEVGGRRAARRGPNEAGRDELYTLVGYGMSMAHSYTRIKPALLARLARIEGQIRGLQKMVEEDKYCIDI